MHNNLQPSPLWLLTLHTSVVRHTMHKTSNNEGCQQYCDMHPDGLLNILVARPAAELSSQQIYEADDSK
jgi:hypothetical protein